MAAILRDSTVLVAVVAFNDVVCTCPRAIPPAMITMITKLGMDMASYVSVTDLM